MMMMKFSRACGVSSIDDDSEVDSFSAFTIMWEKNAFIIIISPKNHISLLFFLFGCFFLGGGLLFFCFCAFLFNLSLHSLFSSK